MAGKVLTLTREQYRKLAAGLEDYAGLRFDTRQQPLLHYAAQQRMQALNIADAGAYIDETEKSHTEWQHLTETVAIHESAFYRHAGQFRALSEIVLPQVIQAQRHDQRLRLWSAACSTGEEPYSLAIAVAEQQLEPSWQVEILATDISRAALKRARAGVFPARRLRNLSLPLLSRYFTQVDEDHYRVNDRLRQMVTFRQVNLARLPDHGTAPTGERNIVFFENVLIYLTRDAAQHAVDYIRRAIVPGGYLFLGYAETLWGMTKGFKFISFGDAFAYQRSIKVGTGPLSLLNRIDPQRPSGPRSAERDRQRRETWPATTRVRDTGRLLNRLPPSITGATMPPDLQSPPGDLAPAFRNPNRSERLEAEALIKGGQFEAASRLLVDWLFREPGNPIGLYMLARVKAVQRLDDDAVDLLRQVLTIDPVHAAGYVLLGILIYRRREYEEALGQFRRALYIDPNQALAYLYQGNIYTDRGDLKRARLAYTNAIKAARFFEPRWDADWSKDKLIALCQANIEKLDELGRATGQLHDPNAPPPESDYPLRPSAEYQTGDLEEL